MDETRQGSAVPLLCLNQQKHTRMEQLKSFYIVISSNGHWGKGKELNNAITFVGKPKKDFRVIQFVLREDTPEEIVENLCDCYSVNGYGDVTFYNGKSLEREKDLKQADEYIIGRITFHM